MSPNPIAKLKACQESNTKISFQISKFLKKIHYSSEGGATLTFDVRLVQHNQMRWAMCMIFAIVGKYNKSLKCIPRKELLTIVDYLKSLQGGTMRWKSAKSSSGSRSGGLIFKNIWWGVGLKDMIQFQFFAFYYST